MGRRLPAERVGPRRSRSRRAQRTHCGRSISGRARRRAATADRSAASAPSAPVAYYGSPSETTAGADPVADGSGGYTLDFDNTPIAAAAQAVLGDILKVGYVIDPRAQGTISLSSARPVAKKDVLFAFESALKASNLALLRDPVGYRIAPDGDGLAGGVDRADSKEGVEAGYGVTVVPVQFVAADTLIKLMDRLLRQARSGAQRSFGPHAAGRRLGRRAAGGGGDDPHLRRRLVARTVGRDLSDPQQLARRDDRRTREGHGLGRQRPEPRHGQVPGDGRPERGARRRRASRTVALGGKVDCAARQRAARRRRGQGLSTALRRREADRRAADQDLRRLRRGRPTRPPARSRPDPGAAPLSNVDRLTGGAKAAAASATMPGAPSDASAAASPFGALAAKFDAASGAEGGAAVRITPDIPNNAILIYAGEEMSRTIERAIMQLDRPKLQVAIDVTIAEVTLNDELTYGVQFFFQNHYGSIGNSTGTTSIVDPALPGFNFIAGNSASPRLS